MPQNSIPSHWLPSLLDETCRTDHSNYRDMYKILAINPGSTSTKVAVYDGEELVTELTLRHSAEEISRYPDIASQFAFRKRIVLEAVCDAGVDLSTLDAVIGRGGLVKPIPSGVYEVNDRLKEDLIHPVGEHASNLGGLIAREIADELGIRAFIADPVVVDELQEEARVTGLAGVSRRSIFHALNQKAMARRYAEEIGRRYEALNLIVAHMGGGISVGAHCRGRVIDVNNCLDGEGPFSPERAGTVQAGDLVSLCFSGRYSEPEVRRMITGKGGLVALLGTNSVQEVVARTQAGDAEAKRVLDAMSYQVGKAIGAAAAVLHGAVDAIILTGGIAHNAPVCDYIRKMTDFIAPVVVRPGENELEALAMNALRVLRGEIEPLVYA